MLTQHTYQLIETLFNLRKQQRKTKGCENKNPPTPHPYLLGI